MQVNRDNPPLRVGKQILSLRVSGRVRFRTSKDDRSKPRSYPHVWIEAQSFPVYFATSDYSLHRLADR